MTTIIRNRTIRPSTRLEKSKSYKIDTKIVDSGDTLIVNIDHESKSFFKSFSFNGDDLKNKNSISFRVNDYSTRIDITWSGAKPTNLSIQNRKNNGLEPLKSNQSSNDEIIGIPPIVNENSKVLILGTMPGAESLKKQAYYSNSRNLFWKLIEEITQKDVPNTYKDKTNYLINNNIAVWDMCQSCIREGSLDSNISQEIPNEINGLIRNYPNIKAIAFNGKEAAKLFGKYIGSIPGIKLIVLPSTSPANAAITWESKKREWARLKDFLK
jgi:hypoxanthine-DNA glycosylase